MSVEIRVPSLGESVTEATVARWFKQIGDPVAADEPLVELETDKVTLEFNAPASGVLAEIAVEEGGEVEVGALLGSISRRRSQRRQLGRVRARARRPVFAEGNGSMAPAVRKLIDEYGLDPSQITPTGPKGNITKGDVLAVIEAGQAGRAKAPAATSEADFEESGRRASGARRSAGGARQSAPAPTPAAAPAVTVRPQPAAPAERKVLPHAAAGARSGSG